MTETLHICWLSPESPPEAFPDATCALREPNGLLAAGGDLTTGRLLYAYRHGIFPWYGQDQPLLWWSPDPRIVLFPNQMHISRSLRRQLRRGKFTASFDQAFTDVMTACAGIRPQPSTSGTWITREMREAYTELHQLGYAHSMEIIMDGELAGGLYGIALGNIFFGESMFSYRPNASKIALACLAKQLHAWGFGLIDCQVQSEHLMRLGCTALPRAEFLRMLRHYTCNPGRHGVWHLDVPLEF